MLIFVNVKYRMKPFALTYGGNYSDEAEMMSQFIEDLYKYEYLILMKQEATL